ncbi:PREDICTED: neuronal pentraxin-2-like, partial [Branchiostoma belcheri]|uniref:Neuronal pentraxin-2-like n=1 Tax=Branchiostoma belcheri TaxID=7741 RepID=A0A6P4YS73_BRABE
MQDLNDVSVITGIIIKGRNYSPDWPTGIHDQYVTSYTISYGDENGDETFYTDADGQVTVFPANDDRDTEVYNDFGDFSGRITARFVKIHPQTWNEHISMRAKIVTAVPGDSQKIIFPGPRGIDDYARMDTTLSEDLASFTLCVHMRSNMDTSNTMSLVSYAVEEQPNELFFLYVNGRFTSELALQSGSIQMADPPVWDGEWHTICTTWRSSDGAWQLYADGTLTASGSGFNVGGRVRTGGTWILAQDQDVVGGGFAASQSFIGELSNVNLWDRVLSPAEIAADLSYHGNVIDWATTGIEVFGQASLAC